ncbi:MAG: M48 family metallopeptidase [Pseudomonadota bacterium]
MNFFQAQDTARRKTGQLVMLFGLAVITLILLTNVLVAVVVSWGGAQRGVAWQDAVAAVPIENWLAISLGVLGVIGVASVFKFVGLRGGGRSIAEALGGHLIHQTTTDRKERRLLNVVEEMAIASGVPVPPVYLIPEASINAFAAGFTVDDAVIGINQGTLDLLDRGELQGVVAHEFSHILNGDMNINLRLIAILHGILFVGMIGYGLLRSGGFSRRNGGALVALGVGLLIVGYGGTFFGNLIKAAVSRQREYLADASAVQFTRDPGGIADALKKIGGYSAGSSLDNPKAEESAHMFFGAAAPKFARSMMATHPPLEERILAIQPNWNGQFPYLGVTPGAMAEQAGVSAFSGPIEVQATPEQVVAQVGQPSPESVDVARTLIQDNPPDLKNAAHDQYMARALIYGMLIVQDGDTAQEQLRYLRARDEALVNDHLDTLLPQIHASAGAHRLTLFEMAVPALKEMSSAQYRRFDQNCAQLITIDKRVDLFEWVLHRLLIKEIKPHFDGPQIVRGRIKKIGRVESEAAHLLAVLASAGHADYDQQQKAYRAGADELALSVAFDYQEVFDFAQLNRALAKLRKLHPLTKPALIKAFASVVLADDHLSEDEGALLHGISATLDCPLPPSIYA